MERAELLGRFEVAVIGAGAIGLAVSTALVAKGVGPIALIDANASPGMGSTGRAAGGMRAQWSTSINIELSRYTIDGYSSLQRASGDLPSFKRQGYLFLGGTRAAAKYLREARTIQLKAGVETELLSPHDAYEIAPYIRLQGLVAASFRADDALFDPHEIVTVLWKEARQQGVCAVFGTRVVGLLELQSGYQVMTDRGKIECNWVVNAAGPGAAQIGAMLDVEVPVLPYRRNVAVTEGIQGLPNLMPMCIDLDTRVATRREGPGCAVMWSDPDEPPSMSVDFDPRYLTAIAERVGNRFPFLESAGIDTRKCWAGLYPETVDGHAIIGPAPEHPRFLQCAGFGGHGVMQSLAAGLAIAELTVNGHCTSFDLHPLRPSRFAEHDLVKELALI